MNPRYIGWIGGLLLLLALAGAALWQANKLVSVGVENGELHARVAELEHQLHAQNLACREAVAQIEEGIAYCQERVSTAEAVGQEWQRKYDELAGRPPRVVRVPVEIESAECTAALIEAQAEVGAAVAAMLMGVHNGGV